MRLQEVVATAKALAADDKGLLAMDEKQSDPRRFCWWQFWERK